MADGGSAGSEPRGNTTFKFGKHRGRTFEEVADSEASYCDWALRTENPSGALQDFVAFLRGRESKAPSTNRLPGNLISAEASTARTPSSSSSSSSPARLEGDALFVCELVQDDQFLVRVEKKSSTTPVGHSSSGRSASTSVYVPPRVWHVLRSIQGAALTMDSRTLAFPLKRYSEVMARLEEMGMVERIPNFVLQLITKARRQKGDAVQTARLPEKLMKYQIEGVEFGMARCGRCLLGDDMGLGKTLQALALAAQYQEDWPVLVVCPSSLRWVWKEQALEWLAGLVADGDVQVIQKGAETLNSEAKIWIISYNLLGKDASRGNFQQRPDGKPHGIVLLDESHNIKDWGTARTKVVVPLLRKATRTVLLSGTPTRNSADELHPQLCGLMPEIGKLSDFRSRYCVIQQQIIHGGRKVSKVVGARCADELNHLLTSTVMIRRLKKDVLSQLPPKRRQRVPIEVFDTKLLKEIRNHKYGKAGVSNFGEDMQETSNLFKNIAQAKLPAVKEHILEVLERGDEKAIIFAHHQLMIDEISELLKKHLPKAGCSHIRIDGGTPQVKRPELVKRFQEEPHCRMAVLSINACGEGLTLTAAGLVIFAELYWVPGAVEQAEARAHRIGSTHSKVVVEFLVVPNSPDEEIYRMLERKKKDTSHVLDGTPESLNVIRQLASQVKRSAEEAAMADRGEGSTMIDPVAKLVASKRAKTQVKEYDTPSPVDRSKVDALVRAVQKAQEARKAEKDGGGGEGGAGVKL
eukprot:TRINITY_DN38492_c0_g2_i1.p1 TRINITY_DN38492_c0_g2~~TRINITY_DN38492_c0_g2_i1.p1  ORF type:complete len:750 (-),score=183.32 TRINITY_DN38492_c0_g2_i1:155-2404(-)